MQNDECTIAEASVLLIHESGKEMNLEFQKDLLEFFYEHQTHFALALMIVGD